jgi:hypothetical protein
MSAGAVLGVDDEVSVDGVADVMLQRADRFFAGLAFGDPAFEVGAAVRVRLAELADRGHVQRVVQLAVPALGQSVHGAPARGVLDGRGAVVGGVVIAVSEACDVAGVADPLSGDDRPNALPFSLPS